MLYPCPACGFEVFESAAGSYDIYPVCEWEDDEVQLRFPVMRGGANKESLVEWQVRVCRQLPLDVTAHNGYRRCSDWRPLTQEDYSDTSGTPTSGREYFDAVGADESLYYWRNPRERGSSTMMYQAPGGTRIIDPTVEALEPIIFGDRDGYWQCGSGDSSLGVVEHRGKQSIAMVKGEPFLSFFLVERHGFFFIYFQSAGSIAPAQYVPFAGGNCRPWVRHNIGGDVFYAPRACFVSRPFAWEIVKVFLRSKSRSPAVPWVDRFSLEFPYPAAGDATPANEIA